MITGLFLAFVASVAAMALVDWRRAWMLAIAVGILQDPVRKITPGTPVVLSMSIVIVYLAVLAAAPSLLLNNGKDLLRRYPALRTGLTGFLFLLVLAGIQGVLSFGFDQWKVPALAFFIYIIPIPAVLLGYTFLRRTADLERWFSMYAVATAIALIGVPLEYMRVNSPVLGTVALGQEWIRHFTGYQVRILSGTFRGPDIMAWHAAMVCIASMIMMVRRGFPRGFLWMGLSGWGFLCCMLSGRRKMIYLIIVFAALFLIRYVTRMSMAQRVSLVLVALIAWVTVSRLSEGETSVYTETAGTTRAEIFQRLEGGTRETIRQYGFMGLGLGAATQGTRHLANRDLGTWQEGGISKFAAELGVPGLVFFASFGVTLARLLFRVSRARDSLGNVSMMRLALVAIIAGNAAAFAASHQPFSDAVLVLSNAFYFGAFLALPRVEEQEAARLTGHEATPTPLQIQTA